MHLSRTLAAAAAAALLVACGGGDDAQAVTFAFRLKDLPASEEFRVTTSSPQLIAVARAQLLLPRERRQLFAAGPIQAGNGGHNLNWSWHFKEVALTEVAIELCDGRPSMVEANLDYWLNTVRSFCPWSSYVHAEIR